MTKIERLREKLAELTTIYNAIPPACPDAQALVQARIDSVKKEIQKSVELKAANAQSALGETNP